MPVTKNSRTGRFEATTPRWSIENFNAGYVDGSNRFRAKVPEHPRASNMGYVLRSIVAYETYHGVTVTLKDRIHHRNENTSDDSKENLELMTIKEHRKHHTIPKQIVNRICENCDTLFEMEKHRLKDTTSKRGRFCSQKCYHEFKRSNSHKHNISLGMKTAHSKRRREQ